ncbi:MAG: RraA family protein, partial [Candidatus Poribacteria bacterium]
MSEKEISIIEMAERFDKIATATVYDTMEHLGIFNTVLDLGIHALRDDMHIAGPAFTIKGERDCRTGAEARSKAMEGRNLWAEVYPGCVVVVDPGMAREGGFGFFGEMTSWHFKQSGARGIVIDGGIRDRPGLLRIPEWSVFVRYTSPIESHPRWRINEIQVPIVLTGQLVKQVRVNPGDFIVGDSDAVLIVPKERAMEVLIKAEEMWEREEGSR